MHTYLGCGVGGENISSGSRKCRSFTGARPAWRDWDARLEACKIRHSFGRRSRLKVRDWVRSLGSRKRERFREINVISLVLAHSGVFMVLS